MITTRVSLIASGLSYTSFYSPYEILTVSSASATQTSTQGHVAGASTAGTPSVCGHDGASHCSSFMRRMLLLPPGGQALPKALNAASCCCCSGGSGHVLRLIYVCWWRVSSWWVSSYHEEGGGLARVLFRWKMCLEICEDRIECS